QSSAPGRRRGPRGEHFFWCEASSRQFLLVLLALGSEGAIARGALPYERVKARRGAANGGTATPEPEAPRLTHHTPPIQSHSPAFGSCVSKALLPVCRRQGPKMPGPKTVRRRSPKLAAPVLWQSPVRPS